MAGLIIAHPDAELVGEASSGREAIALIERIPVDSRRSPRSPGAVVGTSRAAVIIIMGGPPAASS